MRYMRSLPELREAHSYTRQDLALVLGVGVADVARWESGSVEPTVSQWQQIARHFLVPLEQFFTAPVSPSQGWDFSVAAGD